MTGRKRRQNEERLGGGMEGGREEGKEEEARRGEEERSGAVREGEGRGIGEAIERSDLLLTPEVSSVL